MSFQLNPLTKRIEIGLSWDFVDKNNPADVDLSCVSFDHYAVLRDACYFNNKETLDKSIIHNGDSIDGREGGDDEKMLVDLTKIHDSIKAIVISVCCHTTHDFSMIYNGKIIVRDFDANIIIADIPLQSYPGFTALITHVLFRDTMGLWHLYPVLVPCGGRNFEEYKEVMRTQLGIAINPALIEEMKYNSANEIKFNMEKGNILDMGNLKNITMGLGWDVGSKKGLYGDNVDVDGSCIMMSNDKIIDTVFYGKKISNDESTKHSGDNRTGHGEGDDEQIYINLDKIRKDVNCIIFTTTIYSAGLYFSDVKNLYVQMINNDTGKAICYFKISGSHIFNNFNALIVCKLYRSETDFHNWKFMAIGDPEKGSTAGELRHVVQKYSSPFFVPKIRDLDKLSRLGIDKKDKKGKKDKKHKKDKKDKK